MFEKETGAEVTLIFGSSGLLAMQAENRAPFDVFAAANEIYGHLDLKERFCRHTAVVCRWPPGNRPAAGAASAASG